MSIIQEALRRKEQDAVQSSGARPGAPAPAPSPRQPPPLPAKRHRAAPWLLILLLLACLGAAGHFAYYFLRLEWGRRGAPAWSWGMPAAGRQASGCRNRRVAWCSPCSGRGTLPRGEATVGIGLVHGQVKLVMRAAAVPPPEGRSGGT